MSTKNRFPASAPTLVAVAALLFAGPLFAGWPPPGVPSGVMPWEAAKYTGYHEPAAHDAPGYVEPQPASHVAVRQTPEAYTVQITILPYKHEYDERNAALLVAHLPEDAQFFVEGQPTRQTGNLREYLSPPLRPGQEYTYTVRARWREKGKWVEQMHTFPIHAGEVHCVDIVPAGADVIEKQVAASLSRLSAEDRKLAESQKFCAVQKGIRLGSMGVPTKIELKGKAVMLCCPACEEAVRRDPDKALALVEKLKARK